MDEKNIKIYTWIIVLFPVLMLYNSFVNQVSIVEFASILFVLYALLYKRGQLKIDEKTLLMCAFILTTLLIDLLFVSEYQVGDLLGSTSRYLLFWLLLAALTKDFFSPAYGMKCIKKISVIATMYIIVQAGIAKLFNVLLPGGLPLLPTTRPEMRTYIYDVVRYGYAYRPRSIFGEPAHYAQYILLTISVVLFDATRKRNIQKKEILLAVFLSVGILISMSTLGIVTLSCVWGYFLWRTLTRSSRKYQLAVLTFIMVGMPVVLITAWSTPQIQNIIQTKLLRDGGILADNRFVGFFNLDILFDGLKQVLIGRGLMDTEEYLTSFLWWATAFGVLGLILLCWYFYKVFRSTNETGKGILLVFLIQCIASELLMGNYFLFYFTFILGFSKKLSLNVDEL